MRDEVRRGQREGQAEGDDDGGGGQNLTRSTAAIGGATRNLWRARSLLDAQEDGTALVARGDAMNFLVSEMDRIEA